MPLRSFRAGAWRRSRRATRGPGRVPLLAATALLAGAASGQTPATTAAEEDAYGSVAILFEQIQVLQDELRQLRGVIEEQGHRIDQLAREQKDRYIDLDRRLLQASSDAPANVPPPSNAPADGLADSLAYGEEQMYNAAFKAMRAAREDPPSERDEGYAQALERFDALIAAHPNGKFTPNAFYWRGDIELSRNNLETARQAFAQLLAMFGAHAKVPDALYKLGVVHHRLGEDDRALRNFDRVIAEYPDHSAARLSRAYAAELR